MSVTTDEAGIEAIREMSRARVEVFKRKDDGEERGIRIEGEERMVAFAKHLVKMKIEAHKESLAENSDQEGQDDSEDPDLKVTANVLARIGNIYLCWCRQ